MVYVLHVLINYLVVHIQPGVSVVSVVSDLGIKPWTTKLYIMVTDKKKSYIYIYIYIMYTYM